MTVLGLHHHTLVCGDAQRTVDFYVGVLGQRLVKKTVNFDDPGTYHLYFGDDVGCPGTAVTFFEWPGAARGAPGIGGTHHIAWQVADENGLLKWKRRLTDLGLAVLGPYDRHYFTSIYFQDPDGTILEIATQGPGMAVDEAPDALGTATIAPPPELVIRNRDEETIRAMTWPEPVPGITPGMALRFGLHHISAIGSDMERTNAFFAGLLEIPLVKRTFNYDYPEMKHWYWGMDGGRPGTLVTYFEYDPATARRAQLGRGQTHHFALAVADEATQRAWRETLLRAGLRVSPVRDRTYFKSIYTNDPDGHIVELATLGPGFTVDEDMATLGQALQLPPWLEARRGEIEGALKPLTVPAWQGG